MATRPKYKEIVEAQAKELQTSRQNTNNLDRRIRELEEALSQSTAIVPANARNGRLAERQEPELPPVTALAIPPGNTLGVNETATALAASQAKAEVEARFLVALGRPRSIDAARVALLRDCMRPSFAEVAIYERPVGGEAKARGPSIRFAEAAARAWGNINIDSRTIYESGDKRIIAVKVTDLESNVTYGNEVTIKKTVERRKLKKGQAPMGTRMNSYGDTVYLVEATEDDMLSKTNSLKSKSIRTSVIRLLPGDIIDEAIRACGDSLRDLQRKDPDAARKRIVDGFASLNVPVAELADLLGHDIGAASPTEMDFLRGVYTSIKEGEANWSEILTVTREERGDKPGSSGGRSADVKSAIAERARRSNGTAKPAAPKPAAPAKEEESAPASTQEPEERQAEQTPDLEDGRVPLEEEPTDEELGQNLSEDNSGTAPDCKECGNQMVDDINEPGYWKCGPCNRWEKKG